MTTYAVKKGDTLWAIAKRYTGNGARWRELMPLNHDILQPDHIWPGMTINIPLNWQNSKPSVFDWLLGWLR